MRDHTFIRENGERIPVSQMTNDELAECIALGVEWIDEGEGGTLADARLRLEVESIARRLP